MKLDQLFEKNKHKLSDLKEESPERALVARVSNIANCTELLSAISQVVEAEGEKQVSPETLVELKDIINREHARLLHETLLRHVPPGDNNGYQLDSVFELKNIHVLITGNPFTKDEDKDQYMKLWRGSLETRASHLFGEQISRTLIPFQVEDIKKGIESFPYTDEAKRAQMFAVADERASHLFGEQISRTLIPFQVEDIKKGIESFPFTYPHRKSTALQAAEERLTELGAGKK
jgi:hypothetical protein